MDKNTIKKYAVWARVELIMRVSQRAQRYGIEEKNIVSASADTVNGMVLSGDEMKQRAALIKEIDEKGYEQVMEEVAYTWFNRFCALRFMEVNGYLPSRVRVFTDADNSFKPQIIAEAINLELDGLDMGKVYALKDANDEDTLFKYLIITQCNALSAIMPGMFQKISDYTELLFPDNLRRDGSVVEQMIAMIPEEAWQDAIQIIGWLYQYYNSEKKDAVFAALKQNIKITKENIPAATQLFTPDWIVRNMVENSLGRLWVEGHPNDELKSEWKYYLEEAEQEPEVQAQLAEIRKEYATLTPEQIKCIDPCAGSGHILVYMFDVLMQIYKEYGYSAREAVRSIIENNIFGLDIDERAAQLAYFAVMMKARQYDPRFLNRKDEDGNPDVPQPHVYAICESNGIDTYALDYFVNGDPELKAAMDSIVKEMYNAKEYGSILNISPVDFDSLYARFDEVREDINLNHDIVLNHIFPLVQVAETLAQKYDVVVTNPPYMGSSGMSAMLGDFVKKNYPDSKSDLFAVFIEKCGEMLLPKGYQAMITQHAWMFLSSFEKLREKLLQRSIVNMAHLGARAFEEIGGEVVQTTAFVMQKRYIQNFKAMYCRLIEPTTQQGKEDMFLAGENRYAAKQVNFAKIPGSPIAYWGSQSVIRSFDNPLLDTIASPKRGICTCANDKFYRFWHEIIFCQIGLHIDKADISFSQFKWIPLNKGGSFRKWYGNLYEVINWENNGAAVRAFPSAQVKNEEFYFLPAITWSSITSGLQSFRYTEKGFIFDQASNGVFPNGDIYFYLLGLLCTKVTTTVLSALNPSMNILVGDIAQMPISINNSLKDKVDSIVKQCYELSHVDWDSFETSWDFRTHPLITTRSNYEEAQPLLYADDIVEGVVVTEWNKSRAPISQAYDAWEREADKRFETLKANEEELNRIFIDIYGLQDELTPEVEDKDVTVRKAEIGREIRSLISYAVGCMFGRYSLDVEGLAYAGGDWDGSKYKTFIPDKDNILPICDDDYFDDDITSRFVKWVEIAYGAETLEENLKFIADALDGKGTPREVIRNYFLNGFYADHLKIYQKRPIYWLFDSGKKNGFKALIYMHRYAPDTIARMRTDYIHEQQSRYRTAIAGLEQRLNDASTAEKVKLNKQLTKLKDQAAEVQVYEEKIHHLSDQYISIDLDDGVKKNYAIFGDVLAKIK